MGSKRVKSHSSVSCRNHRVNTNGMSCEGSPLATMAAVTGSPPEPAESVIAVCNDQDLLKSIFHRLNIKDLCSASSVCRLWNKVGNSEDFWKEVSFKEKGKVEAYQLAALLSRHRCVRKLDLTGLTCGLDDAGLLSSIAPFLQRLTQLDFTAAEKRVAQHDAIERVLNTISTQLGALKTLNLHGIILAGAPGSSSAVTHPGLTSLAFTSCDNLTSAFQCSSLQKLSLADSKIQRLPSLAACPALVSLEVCGCKKLQDSSVRGALTVLTGLQELTLGKGVPVTDDTVREMATTLTNLTKLVLADTAGLTLNSVRDFPVLRVLDVSRCESLMPAALQSAAESCGQLQVLLLDGCHMLTSLKLSMPHLQEISLRGCLALSDLELNCWRLTVLRLGPMQRGAPGNNTLQRLSISSGAIKKMEWVQCRKLSQLDLKCPYLTELIIRDCDNITPAALEALGDKGPAPASASSLVSSPEAAAPAAVAGTRATGSVSAALLGLPGPGGLPDGAAARRRGGSDGSGEWLVPRYGAAVAAWRSADADDDLEMFAGSPAEAGGLGTLILGGVEDAASPDGGSMRGPGSRHPAGPRLRAAADVNVSGAGPSSSNIGQQAPQVIQDWAMSDDDDDADSDGGDGPASVQPRHTAAAAARSDRAGGLSASAGLGSSRAQRSDERMGSFSAGGSSSDAQRLPAATAASVPVARSSARVTASRAGAGPSYSTRSEQRQQSAAAPSRRARSAAATAAGASSSRWQTMPAAASAAWARASSPQADDHGMEGMLQVPTQDAHELMADALNMAELGMDDELHMLEADAAEAAGSRSRWETRRHSQRVHRDGAATAVVAGAAAAAPGAATTSYEEARDAAAALAAEQCSRARRETQQQPAAAAAAVDLADSDHGMGGMSEDDMPPAHQPRQQRRSVFTRAAAVHSQQQPRMRQREITQRPQPTAALRLGGQQAHDRASASPASSSRRGRSTGALIKSLLPSLRLPGWAGSAGGGSSSAAAAAAAAGPAVGSSSRMQPASSQQQQPQQQQSGTAAAAFAPAAISLNGGFGPGASGGHHATGHGGGGDGGGGGGAPIPIPPPRPGAPSGGGGGVPALRVLRVESCDGLKRLSLKHSGLQVLGVSGCRSLEQLVVAAPQLGTLELDEVGDLAAVSLQQVGLPSLSLGGCSGLSGLELSSKSLASLDLRGCGQLTQLLLDCPTLSVMDATFCSELGDTGLAGAVAKAPPLTHLVLSVCCQVGSSGLRSLSCLSTLKELDLSYTEVSDLAPVFSSCPQLQTLNLSSCNSLARDALAPLLLPKDPALPQLVSLDASYCTLDEGLVSQLLLSCTRLEHLALNGCSSVTDALWQQLEAQQRPALAGELSSKPRNGSLEISKAADSSTNTGFTSSGSSRLQSLSVVRCSKLKSLCLGLLPASGEVEVLQPKHYLLSADRAELHARQGNYGWVDVPSAVSSLTSLRLGLSGVQVLALSLPHLAHLDVSSCSHLRVLELRCPLLLTLHLQACRALPMYGMLQAAVACPALTKLDVQHALPGGAASKRGSNSSSKEQAIEANSSEEATAMEGVEGSGACVWGLAAAVHAHPAEFGSAGGAAEFHQLLDELSAGHPTLQQVLRCPVNCAVCSRAVV